MQHCPQRMSCQSEGQHTFSGLLHGERPPTGSCGQSKTRCVSLLISHHAEVLMADHISVQADTTVIPLHSHQDVPVPVRHTGRLTRTHHTALKQDTQGIAGRPMGGRRAHALKVQDCVGQLALRRGKVRRQARQLRACLACTAHCCSCNAPVSRCCMGTGTLTQCLILSKTKRQVANKLGIVHIRQHAAAGTDAPPHAGD